MVNQELVNYIRSSLSRGVSLERIRLNLSSRGWFNKDIDDSINFVTNTPKEKEISSTTSIKKNSSNNFLKIFGLIFGIVIVAVLIFLFVNSSNKISETEFVAGATINLAENNSIKFNLGEEKHKVKIDSVNENSVDIIIQSEPIYVNLKIGESKKFDLDNDGTYNLKVKLKSIENGKANIFIKKLNESISNENDSEESGTPQTNDNNESSISINPDEITLDIILPKLSYAVDEEVSGDYYLKYQGEPFKGAIIYCDHIGCSKTTGMIDDIDFNNSEKTNALKDALSDTFYSAGTYNYSIYIYDCKDIDNEFNTDDCGNGGWPPTIDIKDIVSLVTPLKSKSKTINVTGENEEYAPECTNNNDCTQSCTNCDAGTYVCVFSSNPLIDQTCVECVGDSNCKDGYDCVNNSCVVEECDSSKLDLCLNETTCTNAGGYWYNEECNEEEQATYPVTNPNTILDCYSENLSEMLCGSEDALGFTTQFENRLELCEVSQGTFALGLEPVMGIFRGYEIQGEQNENCTVKFWFLDNSVIDPSLLNKNMTCKYNSSQRTVQGVNDCFEECCSGQLVDAIKEIQ